MITFLRKFRRDLLSLNKTSRYLKYAIGEIFLVVVGILIALQVNNWNEKRKQDAEFKVTLEQIYNSLKVDVDDFSTQIQAYDYSIIVIDSLLESPDSFSKYQLPYTLHSLSIDPSVQISETYYYAKNLKYSAGKTQQNEISKQIINYVNSLDFRDNSILDDFEFELKRIHLPFPKVDTKSYNSGWIISDSTYYSDNDLSNTLNLVKSTEFKAILKTLRTNIYYLKAKTLVRYGDGISLMNIIKKYYPDIKILFQDVGIKGTAIDGFDNVGGLSTPMAPTDEENNIWEIDIHLLKGNVKFRCRDSWAQNWGNSDFPKGVGLQDGPDIPVPEAGDYHVTFKPVTGEYEFIKQDD